MKKMVVTLLVLVMLLSVQTFARDSRITNERFVLGAMSLCALNETLQGKESLDVFVLGDDDVAEELKIFLDQRVGFIKLNSITQGDKLPETKPDVLLVCDENMCKTAIDYCRDNKVFSVTNVSQLCQKGLSSAIVAKSPGRLQNKYSMTSVYAKINKEALFAEGMVFHPQVMDVAKPVDDNKFEKDLVMVQLY